MRHIIFILMENEAGALSRVAGLFSARGYNIESLSVAATDDPTLSRLSLVTTGSEDIVEQFIKQLNKLIDVVKLMDLTEHEHIERELLLVKFEVDTNQRPQLKDMADIFGATIIDVSPTSYTVQLTANGKKLKSFLDATKSIPVIEIVRSGSLGIARGDVALKI